MRNDDAIGSYADQGKACSSTLSVRVDCRRKLDLGQFERFKRVFFTPWFAPLIGHHSVTMLSQILVTDDVWRSRVLVQHGKDGEAAATYEVTMRRVRNCSRGHFCIQSA